MPSEKYLEPWNNGHVLNAMFRCHYRPDFPFHNLRHGQLVSGLALDIAKVAMRHGVDIETDIFRIAGRGHDAGIHLRPGIDHPFDTPEEYSGDIMRRIGQSLGMSPKKLLLARTVIDSTAQGVRCKNDTARCFRQADLAAGGLLDSPIAFLNGTYRLYQEEKIKNNEPTIPIMRHPDAFVKDFLLFGKISYGNLNAYLEEDVSLGAYQRDNEGRSLFALHAAQNVNLLVPDKLKSFLSGHLSEIISYKPVTI